MPIVSRDEFVVALLDCHYKTQKRKWEYSDLEIKLGREINDEISKFLFVREVPIRWYSSDSIKPKSVFESHKYKADCVLSHSPVPAVTVEIHYDNAPPNNSGFIVEYMGGDDMGEMLASKIRESITNGTEHKCRTVVHPDDRYVMSGLFNMLSPKSSFVLVEAGNLNNDKIRNDYVNHGELWTNVTFAIAYSILSVYSSLNSKKEVRSWTFSVLWAMRSI